MLSGAGAAAPGVALPRQVGDAAVEAKMTRRTALDIGAVIVGLLVFGLNASTFTNTGRAVVRRYYRHRLFAAIRPVPIANCTLGRFGNAHDGGYLLCENLLPIVRSAYSYGIEGRDEWGCAIAGRLGVPVHQYDCFVTARPACPGARFLFNEECVGRTVVDAEGRRYDTLQRHIARNGDEYAQLVVKMDVEGAEWDALGSAPDSVLANISQLVVEFHEVDEVRFVRTIEKLNEMFVIAHVHFNNFTCHPGVRPFPAWAFEVLFVNRQLTIHAPVQHPLALPHLLDSPNDPSLPDCQADW